MDVPKSVQIDCDQDDWAKEILSELEENIDQEDRDEIGQKSKLTFIGEMIKKNNSHLNDFMILTGQLNVEFITYCTSTGAAMSDSIDVHVQAVFIQDKVRDKYGHEEDTEIFVGDEVYDLFFVENDQVDIAPVINEFVFLNKNQYPKKSPKE